MRKLVSIERIFKMKEHTNADLLEIAQIKGWNCVVEKGIFSEGDLGVYFEIDSFIPISKDWFTPKNTVSYEGLEGTRIRTMKFRGEVSQGLLMPISSFEELQGVMLEEGLEVTDLLGVKKYEKPIDLVSGDVLGYMPGIIRKTDQERIQNIMDEDISGDWEISEKLEGVSCTLYFLDNHFGVCGKQLEYLRSEDDSFWKEALRLDIESRLIALGRNLAIQGEFIGPKLQSNIYNLKTHQFRVFDIQDLDRRIKLLPEERISLIEELNKDRDVLLLEAPRLEVVSLKGKVIDNIEELLLKADGYSLLADKVWREGLVFKSLNENRSFKVISNKYLLKEK